MEQQCPAPQSHRAHAATPQPRGKWKQAKNAQQSHGSEIPGTSQGHLQPSRFLPDDTGRHMTQNTALLSEGPQWSAALETLKNAAPHIGRATARAWTPIFTPGLKSRQGDGQILPEVVHGMFRNLSFFPKCIPWRWCRDWTQSDLQLLNTEETKAWKSQCSPATSRCTISNYFQFSLSGNTVLPPPMALLWITSYTGLLFGFQHRETRN